MRLGVEAAWRFDKWLLVVPWVGAGFGYEWANYKATEGADTLKLTYRGLEYLDLKAGVDYPLLARLSVGPFVSYSLGRYTDLTVDSPLGNSTGGIPSESAIAG